MLLFKFLVTQFKKIFFCKFIFVAPKKKGILIFDRVNSDIILECASLNKEECSVFDIRYESLNFFILLKALKCKKNFKQNYILEYIKFISPKLILTFNNTNPLFFKLKKRFSKIKFISIQNGLLDHNFLKNEKKKNLKIDYIFCFNDFFKKYYSNRICGKVIPGGPIKKKNPKKK